MLDGPQPVRVLDLAEEQRVVPVRLHRVGGDHGPVQRQRGEHRLEVADLVRLPGLGDPVLGDDQAGDVSDRGEQVHLLLPARFGALALLAVDGDRGPRGNVPGIPARGGIKPGMGRVRPEPAVFPLLREAGRGRRLPLSPLPSFLLSCPLFRAVRSIRGRDPGSSAIPATAAETARPRTRPRSSRNFPSLSSIDADGATRSPVRGLTRQPCAASTSWSQPSAACATASGP